MDIQPTLTGKLLSLRPLCVEDFDDLYAVASDPLIWEQHPRSDRYKEEVFRQFFADAMNSGGALAALDQKTGRIIGSSRFRLFEGEDGPRIEIGWTFLGREFWGGEYNGEMKRLMLEHAFKTFDRAFFYIGSNNVRSQRAVAKIGGEFVGHIIGMDNIPTNIYEVVRSNDMSPVAVKS